jgi:anaerobic ribonucleoside-triphosphate reductase activating protein
MQIRLASDLQEDSIVDGPGIRTVIWTQGCSHNCPSCHNPATHDFKGGFLVSVEDINKELSLLEGQDGITFSGGDPLFQKKACKEIASYAKKIGLNVWCYTGFLFEDLIKDKDALEFLKYVDVLVDGKFIEEQKSLNLYYKGSRNQRIIDVKKSLEENKVILVPEYAEDRDYRPLASKPKNIYL